MKKKIIISGLVGCLILGNVSVSIGDKVIDGNTKDELSNSTPISVELKEKDIKVETEIIKPNIDNAEIDIKIPVVKGLKDSHYEEELNSIIKTHTEKDIKEFEKDVEELLELDIEWEPQMIVEYEVKSHEDILSFVIGTYTFTGGAHGSSRKDYYNIDLNKNKAIQLADLFKEDSDFKTIINDEINKEIKKQIATEEKSYFTDDQKFTTIDDAQNYYINKDGNIVIAFQPYDITPWYMGHPEFEIPKKSISNILKHEKDIMTEDIEVISFDKVIINDKELKLKSPMFKSEKDTVMIPFREVAEALDFKVTWDQKNKVANINKGAVSAGTYIGEDKYYFSKAFVFLEEGAQLINSTTYVPMSFIDEVIKGEKFVDVNGVLNIKY